MPPHPQHSHPAHPQHPLAQHPHPQHLPPGYPSPYDYTPGGMPPMPGMHAHEHQSASPPGGGGRTLSSSKRAEQNRKAQRAFRERRDQHVKALESRSQLLDTALASADEANRRWEECRVLVDQLRVENAALKGLVAGMQASGMQPQQQQQQQQQQHGHPHADGDDANSSNDHGAS
ncbi:hypothetical protein FIBSPDRAFT_987654 [Athelia psychrophila]|uniref:BZIP domain-containing protein n=1 Tax=Athelia psychrophila TaxID=1759441 RepID=A0A166AH64_9AGAM|nr:hypothetical protein FIBSPDRAFT_987654 [Fibularhizoctonia sp. CBS 109695]